MYNLLILQIAAHAIADFSLQSDRWSKSKESKGLKSPAIYYHVLIVTILSFILSFDFSFWMYSLAIGILHFLIDILKTNHKIQKLRYLFFIDQIIHIGIIFLVVLCYSKYFEFKNFYGFSTRTYCSILGFILCLKPANIFIKEVLNLHKIKCPEETGLFNAGKLIGVIERILSLSLILAGQFSAVGFIFAAKSIIRFHEREQGEYYLTGTLLSFSIAILSGLIIIHGPQ